MGKYAKTLSKSCIWGVDLLMEKLWDKFNNISFTKKILISTFIFFLVILYLTPITGDDWGNYLIGKNGVNSVWNSAISMYKVWEGRFISRLFLNFFTYHKWAWNILNSMMIIFLIWCSYQIIGKQKNKVIYILPILCLLLVSRNFFSQCYLWLAGNMTYLFPAVMVIGVIFYCYYSQNKKTIFNIILCLVSFLIPMFVENIGCAYIVCLLFWIGYVYYKERKISKLGIIMLLLSCSSLTCMLLSPGSRARMEMSSEFYQLTIFERILRNLPNLVYYMFFANGIVLLIMMFPVSYTIGKQIKNKVVKYIVLFIWNIIPFITIIQNLNTTLPINFLLKLIPIKVTIPYLFPKTAWYVILYWALFTFIFLLSIFYIIKNKDEALKLCLFTMVGISSMLVMLFTPTWGERVSALYVFTIFIVSIKLISIIYSNPQKIFTNMIYMFLILFSMYYSVITIHNYIFDMWRIKNIEQVKEQQKTELLLYANRMPLLWNYDPWGEYHLKTFCSYYQIPENVKVKLIVPNKEQWFIYLKNGKVKKN